jgi:hypothetical protein
MDVILFVLSTGKADYALKFEMTESTGPITPFGHDDPIERSIPCETGRSVELPSLAAGRHWFGAVVSGNNFYLPLADWGVGFRKVRRVTPVLYFP